MSKLVDLLTRDEKKALTAKVEIVENAVYRTFSSAFDDATTRIDEAKANIEATYEKLRTQRRPALDLNYVLDQRAEIVALEELQAKIVAERIEMLGKDFKPSALGMEDAATAAAK